MDIFIDGTKGAGKSYYAVNYIKQNYKKYKTIYTNINGFKFNRVHTRHKITNWLVSYSMDILDYSYQYKIYKGVNWNTPSNAKALNWTKILDIVQECKDIYDTELELINEDDDSIELDDLFIDYLLSIDFIHYNPAHDKYLEALAIRENKNFILRTFLNIFSPIPFVAKYFTVLIVMDEAGNFFDKQRTDPLLMWLISYSRHMFIDFILLSQSYTDLHQNYLKRMEYFLFALPSSRQTRPGYKKYKKHVKTPYYDGKGGTGAGDVFVKEDQLVFTMYKSGNKTAVSSVFYRYIIFVVLFSIAFIAMVIFLYSYLFTGAENKDVSKFETVKKIEQQIKGVITDTSTIAESSTYMKLNCINTTCSHKDITFSIYDLEFLLKSTESTYLRSTKISKFQGSVYIIASEQFKQLFIGANRDDKSNSMGTIFK